MSHDVVLLDAARTAFAPLGGALRKHDSYALASASAQEAVRRARVKTESIDQFWFSSLLTTESMAQLGSRLVHELALAPCAYKQSGEAGLVQALYAVEAIKRGESQCALVVATESISCFARDRYPNPYRSHLRNNAYRQPEETASLEERVWDDIVARKASAMHPRRAEALARKYNLTRKECDEYAFRAQQAAARAQGRQLADQRLQPLYTQDEATQNDLLECTDSNIQHSLTLKDMDTASSAFRQSAVLTRANSAALSDGSAALIFSSAQFAAQAGLAPIAYVRAHYLHRCDEGVDNSQAGNIASVKAVNGLLTQREPGADNTVDLTINSFDLLEIEDSFAPAQLLTLRQLRIERGRTNLSGGGLALGNALSASGLRVVLAAAYELRARRARYALAAAGCEDGKAGALALERIQLER